MSTVVINKKDNVGVSLDGNEKIPAGHKFALRDILKDEYVIKYGEIIGKATVAEHFPMQEISWIVTTLFIFSSK